MGKISLVLGIRPDVIRASLLIRNLREALGPAGFEFIWSGQHYSDNMKDVFFRQLGVGAPDSELAIDTQSDTNTIGALIKELGYHWEKSRPDAAIFLGDTNTVCGSLAAASLNIPIVHIEGCMRSYDWRMPEEKYRTSIDHLSDVIYAYVEEYKLQGVAEGLRPSNIVVSGNPIVDVIQHYFLSGKIRFTRDELEELRRGHGLEAADRHWVMTCHRRENVDSRDSLERIMGLARAVKQKVVFPAGYRTQRRLKDFAISVPSNVFLCDPIGYAELLELIYSAEGVLTDSGTIVEEASVLGIPSVQMRTSTERPQVYDCGGSIKFDPHFVENDTGMMSIVIESLRARAELPWTHGLGDGKSSTLIANDLIDRYERQTWAGHLPEVENDQLASRNFGWGLEDRGKPSSG